MSVEVVSNQTLVNAGVTNLRDLANVTSGYQLGAGGAYPQPAIRGVTTIINGTFENNVAVYVDGLYQPVPLSLNIDLPNIESVQVLKGPQGSLYGRNATGGALLLTTISPTDTWRGKAELTYARFDDKRISSYVAGPLSDSIGMSLAGYLRRSDGYMRLASRTTPGESESGAVPIDQDAIRAKLRFTPTDQFTATLAYSYTRVSDSSSNIFSPLENVNANPYAIRPGGATRPQELNVTAYDFAPINVARQHEGGLTLELDTDLGKLKSISGYAQVKSGNLNDFDGSYIPSSITVSTQRERTFQQALDFTVTKFDIVDLIVGATYFHDRLILDPTIAYAGLAANVATNPGTTPGNLATDYTIAQSGYFNPAKSAWAAYFDATVKATDRLSINAGGRYSEERQSVESFTMSPFPTSVRNPTSAKAKFSRFTPRVSVRYEVGPRSNIYVSYSQGFRSGAFNNALPSCVNLVPVPGNCYVPARQETIQAWEAGFKTAGRGFRFEVAGFHYDYKGLQVSATRALVVNGTTFPVVELSNAPGAKIYGADSSAEWKPVENLTLRASATWLHARYGKNFFFTGTGVATAGPGGGVGINVNDDPLKSLLNVSQLQNLSGQQMSRAPNFSASAGVEYLIPQGEGGIRLSLNGKYTSRYVVTNPSIWCEPTAANGNCAGIPADRQREQRFTEGAFVLLNASVTWTDPTDHYLVRLWGTNLTDHRYRLHYSGTATGTYGPLATPTVYGITVGAKM